MKDLAIYIHIPFCSSKCYYCDFISFPGMEDRMDEYMNYMMKEMDLYREVLSGYNIRTIFIGGGTPSHIDGRHIYNVLEYIHSNFNCNGLEEITMESNPESLDEEKLNIYAQAGIDRISIGLQSLDDGLLKGIGRCHNAKDFYRAYDLVRKVGFEDVNLDLMFGLPNQSLRDCRDTLEEAISLDSEHISLYSLILEEGTPMDRWYEDGRIELPDDELERDMYHMGQELLRTRGYHQYEISNFCKEGFECKHNLYYWKLKPYIGFGLSAHSNMDSRRFWNYSSFEGYYNSLDKGSFPIEGEEHIDTELEMAEYMIMGLRMIKGIDRNEFHNRFHIDVEDIYGAVLEEYESRGLLDMDGGSIRFTPRGLDLSNLVYVDLLPE
ncbi:MAG: oxygen-independent coproporphyrinogen III oxidase [Tissierellia bacterium]|nr:oxygen-independent coproporphyrinogen III oxidase [Tissierellia bacterium]